MACKQSQQRTVAAANRLFNVKFYDCKQHKGIPVNKVVNIICLHKYTYNICNQVIYLCEHLHFICKHFIFVNKFTDVIINQHEHHGNSNQAISS